jgi:hypothetical protein
LWLKLTACRADEQRLRCALPPLGSPRASHGRCGTGVGAGIAINLTTVVLGGIPPFVAAWLVARTGSLQAPAYFVVAILFSFVASIQLRDLAGKDVG